MPNSSAKKAAPTPPAPRGRDHRITSGMKKYPLPAPTSGRVLLNTDEAARKLGCHKITLWTWMKKIPDFPRPIRISPNKIAFFDDELDTYIESRPRI
jgi:prophage regulatory protein